MSENLTLPAGGFGPRQLDYQWYDAIRAELVRGRIAGAGRVLDVGCGCGGTLLGLAKRIEEGVGVDIDGNEIAHAERARKRRKVRNVRFEVADAAELPFAAGSFDAVLLLGDVLTFAGLYGKHKRVVSEVRRVLRTGGVAVHESTNWEWAYRNSPTTGVSVGRTGDGGFTMLRGRRSEAGLEVGREYRVRPDTRLHRWLAGQEWPRDDRARLQMDEAAAISQRDLEFVGLRRCRHYRGRDLIRLYRRAGFGEVRTVAYGQTYDIAVEAGLDEELWPDQREALAKAEAAIVSRLSLGSGPWLFLTAR